MKPDHLIPDPFPDLAKGEVHVWKCALPQDTSDLAGQFDMLSGDEQERADRFKVERPRRQFIIARSTLRSLLGRYLNRLPSEIIFRTAEHGKPELHYPEGRLQFNVSHSQELVLLAFSRSAPVGIDVEWLGGTADHSDVAGRFFSGREQSQLQALPPADRPRAFMECWTRKEAYLKARGFGLSRDTRTFSVSITGSAGEVLLEDNDDPSALDSWSIQPIHLGQPADYCAALAAQSPLETVKCLCLW